MTREEAISRLKNTAWLGTNADQEHTEEAVDMAIEALSTANLKEEFESAEETIEIKPMELKGDFHIDDIDENKRSIFEDIVWVVRCKDCRFYWGNLSEDDTDEMYGECRWDSDEMPDADDFCSYGERGEE